MVVLLSPFFRLNVLGRVVLGGLAPFTVNWERLIGRVGRGIVTFLMISVPQFEMFTGMGAMKSFSSEVKELPEERLFRVAEPKCLQTPGGKMPAAGQVDARLAERRD